MSSYSRKSFLKKVGATGLGVFGMPYVFSTKTNSNTRLLDVNFNQRTYSANDRINIAVIGAGIMGQGDVDAALENDGVQLVAACDLYDSRLVRCREKWGKEIDTTKDYREVLQRDDVDSVIIAVPDFWHQQIAIDALKAGKAVYLEKPMVQHIEEGQAIIDAVKETGGLLQVGSQSTSSVLNAKAKELIEQGAIGDLNFVECYWDRQSFSGAWNYSIPPSAGPENIDWDTYLKDLPKEPFNAEKFFRWRKFRSLGTGVAGDLFVHHFSALHFVTGSMGPERIYGTGGIRFWDDGRDVPDVMLAVFDYPETDIHNAFNLSLRVNFADGSGGGYSTRMVGTDGELIWGGGELKLRRSPMAAVPDMFIDNYSEAVQQEYIDYHKQKYPDPGPQVEEPNELTYTVRNRVSGTTLHHKTLFDAMRGEGKIIQNATFGLRAAAPALAANMSYFENRPVHWDAEKMALI